MGWGISEGGWGRTGPTAAGGSGISTWQKMIAMTDDTYDAWWTARAADTGCDSLWRASSGDTLTEAKGNYTPTSGQTKALISGAAWAAWDQFVDTSATAITGTVIVRGAFVVFGTSTSDGIMLDIAGTGEDEEDNVTVQVTIGGDGAIKMFHEQGAGTNTHTIWDSGGGPGIVTYFTIEREDKGSGNCEMRLWASADGAAMALINVDSVSGMVDNTTYSSGVGPTGGATSTYVKVFAGSSTFPTGLFLQVVTGQTTSLVAEQAILTALLAEAA